MSEAIRLTPEQRRAVKSRGGAILVSAAAGAGKTKVLVERLMGYICDSESPRDITDFLVITYTRAAAAELRSKIISEITARMAEQPGFRHLRRQATLCLKASIGTIHSFCTDVIRENSHALDISPDFRVMDDSESAMIKTDVLDGILERHYLAIDDDNDFRILVDSMAGSRGDRRLCEAVLDAHAKLQCHPEPRRWVGKQLHDYSMDGVTDLADTPWGAELMAWARRCAAHARASMVSALEEMEAFPDMHKAYGGSFAATIESISAFLKALDVGWDAAAACADFDFPSARISGYEEFKAIRTHCKDALAEVTAIFAADSGEAVGDMRETYPAVSAFLRLLLEFDEAYAAEKRRRSALDFSDQEHMCARLLYDFDERCPTELARSLSSRFCEILVDEYQDVNAVQELVFSAVSRHGKNLFMVGDVKQSIYRFRLADPTIFLRKYRSYAPGGEEEDGEPCKILLPKNFRSRAGVLDAVNYVFQCIMSVQNGEMDYTPDEFLAAGRGGEEPPGAAFELDVLNVSDDTDAPGKLLAEASFTASRIRELVDSGMQVPDGRGGLRCVEYGDFCILLRSMKNKAWQYAAALSEQGIPVALSDSESFFEAFEISVMLALLAVIDNPMQDVPLVTVLKSPIFGFTPDELAGIRASCRGGDYYSALNACAESSEKCASFLETLNALRSKAPDMTAEELIFHIYDSTSFYAVAGAMDGGERRQRNLLRLAGYARAFEKNGYRGLFGFATYMRAMMERGSEPETADARADTAGVSIMSIHKSKGLEFPVVIIADTAKLFNLSDSVKPVLFHPELGVGMKRRDLERRIEYPTLAREAVTRRMAADTRSEEVRVLYVAMTRAKDKLIITAAFKDAAKYIEKLRTDASAPIAPGVLEGKRCFADWLLLAALTRPEAAALNVSPATAHRLDLAERWDIRLCEADGAALPAEITPDEQRAADDKTPTLDELARLSDALIWRYPFESAVSMPSKLTATELKGRLLDSELYDDARVEVPAAEAPVFRQPRFITGGKKLTAAQRGTALHLAMQYIDFAACTSLSAVRAELVRLREQRFLSDEQADAADPAKLWGFFASPLGRRVLSAKQLSREFKFSVLLPASTFLPWAGCDEILFQGVVDCFFEENGALTVIDFKSDRVTGETMAEKVRTYTPQLSSYAAALRVITGKEINVCILYFFANGAAVEIEE